MMMAQGGVSLPAGYTKLEYLESDGNSYIDTGFKPNQDTRVIFKGYNNSANSKWIFGACNLESPMFGHFSASCASASNICYHTNRASIADMGIGDINIDMNKNEYTYNGVSATLPTGTFTCGSSIYLFGLNIKASGAVSTTGTFIGRIYSVKIYDNGTLVRDFIPAMNASGEAGLYDLKNDVWYGFKQVVTKKKNKISIEEIAWNWEEISNPITGESVLIRSCRGKVTSAYHVDTNISGEFRVEGTSNYIYNLPKYDSTVSIQYSRPRYSNGLGPSIVSISPTEDDTYIYTF